MPDSGWIVKIPPTCKYVSKFSGEKFPEMFTEMYYIGIALKQKNINVKKKDIDTAANSLDMIGFQEYANKIFNLSNLLTDEDLKLSINYCRRILPVRFGEIIINKFLEKNNALKNDWFKSYAKTEGPLGVDVDNHKFDFNDEKKKLWIDTLKINDVENFSKNVKSGKIKDIFDDYNKG